MKRSILILVCVLLAFATEMGSKAEGNESAVQVGDSLYLGRYEQDNKTDNGMEPIEWIVVAVENEKAMLVSRQALDCLPFAENETDVTWKESTIRKWLNDTFYAETFTEDEKKAVLLSTVSNNLSENNPEWGAFDVDDTNDHVFLLSYREAINYFFEKDERKASGTDYARERGARFLGVTSLVIGETDWWLRSSGKSIRDAAYVDVKGVVNSKKNTTKMGIRPAIWVDLTVDRSFFPYEQMITASRLEEDGIYDQAAAIFEALGSYSDSETRMMRCNYQYAIKSMDAGDYNTALRLFETLGDYEDSYLKGRESRYALAVKAYDEADYSTALKLFEQEGKYEDSIDKLKECYEKLGISLRYFTEEAVDAGTDKGYQETNPIDGKNRHFGWDLGHFFMSGFTRVTTDAETKNPVFIKTLGDSVTLWFDLEKDIDALNGNTNYIISEDKNGYSEYFGVRKTNFGRGTLIIRQTDYQNKKGEPQIYTDFLLARGTTGADTKVILNEEGDYEAALYYEIEDKKAVLGKYSNYKIFLNFSVRNGNCMVYPFDVLTGSELANTSVTPNGFYLDLAKSRYLDIDVKRSVIVSGPSGMTEDVRFSRPAKDGDQYTAEGIYTISVSNRYTEEKTTKTIFVGSEELLQEYISNGFSLDRLN